MVEPLQETGMAPVGAHRLAYTRMGAGSPAVVLESAYGAPRGNWDTVLPAVARFTSVICYDRAGLGESEPAGRRRTLADLTRDLSGLLDHLQAPGPYVLVGSSIGGHIARYFAYHHPHQAAGLVLLDGSHPDGIRWTLAALPPPAPEDSDFLQEWRRQLTSEETEPDDPEENPEGVDFAACDEEARAASTLGDLPLVVIAAANHAKDEGDPFNDPALVPPALAAALEQAHLEAQADLTRLSTRGRLVIARASGHLVHRYEPDLVVNCIHELVEAYRTGAPAPGPSA